MRTIAWGLARFCALPALFVALTLGPATGQEKDGERTIRGTVRGFLTAPRGETDGLVLDDDTLVRFPPHLGERVRGLVGKGDRVRVSGWPNTGPKGDAHFRATSITNIASGKSLEITEDKGPKEKGKGPKGKGKKGKGPKEEGPKDRDKGADEEVLRAPRDETDGAGWREARIRALEAELRRLRREQASRRD